MLVPVVLFGFLFGAIAAVEGQQDVLADSGNGPARISCTASFNAPCSRVNSEYLAVDTAQILAEQLLTTGISPQLVFDDVTKGLFNLETNFYPFVFERDGSKCVAHGSTPGLVGMTLEEIFDEMGIGFSLSDKLHQRFVSAAEQGGGWVQYTWRETPSNQHIQDGGDSAHVDPIKIKIAFVTNATDDFYIGVGYVDEQLPLDLPCSSTVDSWCSINNVQSLVGLAETRLSKAVNLEQFEAVLYDISFDRDEYFVPGGYYLFMYQYDGALKAHFHLNRFTGQDLAYIFEQLDRDPQEGANLHLILRDAAEGNSWVQYRWKNKIDEPEYTKIAYVVSIEFMGEKYYLGCGFNHIRGDIVSVTRPRKIVPSDVKETEVDDCPGFNLPCTFGILHQLTSHAVSHIVSSSQPTDEMFGTITNDPQFQIGSSYVSIYDFNSTCVANGGNPQLVGLNIKQVLSMRGFTEEEATAVYNNFRSTVQLEGGYLVYDWPVPDAAGHVYQRMHYVFHLILEGTEYFGSVGFDRIMFSTMLELDTGTQQNGEMIPCSSQYGSTCSEINSQAIVGQALSDLILASSETKVRATKLPPASIAGVQAILNNITAGEELYKVNDFYVSVFSVDQSSCYSTKQGQVSTLRDESGCCVAHGQNPEYVGRTWQDILDSQKITSIRGRDLHDRLLLSTDSGGNWMEYSWAQSSGGARTKIAFSSRFHDNTESHYVVVEYFAELPPPTCDNCPSGMACTESGQYFCEPHTLFVKTAGFALLMITVLGIPFLGIFFGYLGKRREKLHNKAQMERIDQQIQTMTKRVEDEKKSAHRAQKLVASFFPENVQERIVEQLNEEDERSAIFDEEQEGSLSSTTDDIRTSGQYRPIADLFPDVTVCSADIIGFTAWSSTREPIQVFGLLETMSRAFDKIASRAKVFKVETAGECYAAVCGLPEPNPDHAVVMAEFAFACLAKFQKLVGSSKLELDLGPGTCDLMIQIGLHSGPVTAGVVRGHKARFQLFGDTVHKATTIETTGAPNRIHLSQETANHLLSANKSHWVTVREDTVNEDKRTLNTFWLEESACTLSCNRFLNGSVTTENPGKSDDTQEMGSLPSSSMGQIQALVDWNVNMVESILLEVVAKRQTRDIKPTSPEVMQKLEKEYLTNPTSLKEVKEIVSLPKFEADIAIEASNKTELSDTAAQQLRSYIYALSTMYNNSNPFHNFEHATHVSMSVVKLISRIIEPDRHKNEDCSISDRHHYLHELTYGITSDPLTRLAVLLSALIHDADHPGVPNVQLLKESSQLTSVYKQSIAELNSFDLAWNLLMSDKFKDLRRHIYTTKSEFLHFRQLMVNIVLATDIMDKDLGALRKHRWDKAFGEQHPSHPSVFGCQVETNRKATIVLEHIIQASDVAHTMQHWHVYLKWNERFFMECYAAYKAGRAEKDPSESWYDGEIGFFDFYIIPLANKLHKCGVFGVSSAEYLAYAKQNKNQWITSGRQIVAGFVKKAEKMPTERDIK